MCCQGNFQVLAMPTADPVVARMNPTWLDQLSWRPRMRGMIGAWPAAHAGPCAGPAAGGVAAGTRPQFAPRVNR